MYGWHAWIDLRLSPEQDGDSEHFDAALRQIREGAQGLDIAVRPSDPVFSVNYVDVFQATASRNHTGRSHELLLRFLERIVSLLPASTGLVYWWDDEAPTPTPTPTTPNPSLTPTTRTSTPTPPRPANRYRVIVIAHGQVTHRNDPFELPIDDPAAPDPATPGP